MKIHESVYYQTLNQNTTLKIEPQGNNLVIPKSVNNVYSSSNSIMVVNGISCYSTYDDNKVTIHSANLLTNKYDNDIRDVIALDFSDFGELYKYKLSDCEKIFTTGLSKQNNLVTGTNYLKSSRTFSSYKKGLIGLAFKLPKNARIGIPILCLGGRLFFPNLDRLELFKTSAEYGVFFSISRVTLEGIISSNSGRLTPMNHGTNLNQITLSSFLDNLFDDAGNPIISFVGMLISDKILYTETTESISTFERGIIRFPSKSYGMLVNKYTREIVDYVKIEYDSETHVTVSEQHKRYLAIKDDPSTYTKPQLGYSYHNYNESDIHNPFNSKRDLTDLNDLMLLDISWYTDYKIQDDIPTDTDIDNSIFSKLKFIKSKQYLLHNTTTYPTIYLEPVTLQFTNYGSEIVIYGKHDAISGTYELRNPDASGKDRIWDMFGDDDLIKYHLQYNDILQGWTIVYPDGKTIYQSSLSATWQTSVSVNDIEYYNPWDTNLFWFKPINRL